jgi:two-component system KDP operon response regulator KdpE
MNPKVLLVDRTDAHASAVSTALEQRHFQVRVAATSAASLDADDHIVKPCSHDQLAARIRVALRRNGMVPDRPTMAVGNFQIDFGERRVRFDGSPIRLTPKEFDLFVFMARNPNRELTHRPVRYRRRLISPHVSRAITFLRTVGRSAASFDA